MGRAWVYKVLELETMNMYEQWENEPRVSQPAIIRVVSPGGWDTIAFFKYADGSGSREIDRKEANAIFREALIKYVSKHKVLPRRNFTVEDKKTVTVVLAKWDQYRGNYVQASYSRKALREAMKLAFRNARIKERLFRLKTLAGLLEDELYLNVAISFGARPTNSELDKYIDLARQVHEQIGEVRADLAAVNEKIKELQQINKDVTDWMREALLCIKKQHLFALSSLPKSRPKIDHVEDIMARYDKITLVGLLARFKENEEAFANPTAYEKFLKCLFPRLEGKWGLDLTCDFFTAWNRERVEEELRKAEAEKQDLENQIRALEDLLRKICDEARAARDKVLAKLRAEIQDLQSEYEHNVARISKLLGGVVCECV